MNLLSLLTLIGFGLVLAAVAVYLVTIAWFLRKTLFTLGTVNVGLRAIAQRVEPLEPLVDEINTDLSGVRDQLAAVLERKGAASS
ncbi:MAG: hypothetical protein M3391_09100 [Actinomycetota bacterium]|nr:hypothetical protein [Actinomycetota bacterium]